MHTDESGKVLENKTHKQSVSGGVVSQPTLKQHVRLCFNAALVTRGAGFLSTYVVQG